MDVMEQYEVSYLVNGLEYADRNSWEQTRLMMYIMAQVNSSKKLSPEKIIKFKWDNIVTNETKPMTETEIKMMQDKMNAIIKKNMI